MVIGRLSPGVKQPGSGADHSPSSSAEIKSAWDYISTPPYVFMAWCSVKQRDNFIFTFTFSFTWFTLVRIPLGTCLRTRRPRVYVYKGHIFTYTKTTCLYIWRPRVYVYKDHVFTYTKATFLYIQRSCVYVYEGHVFKSIRRPTVNCRHDLENAELNTHWEESQPCSERLFSQKYFKFCAGWEPPFP